MLLIVYSPITAANSSPDWARALTMALIVLALLLAGLVATGREGTELDADNQLYRRYFGLLGWRFGRWQPLPPVAGVTLKFFTEVSRGNAGNGATSWGVWDTSGTRLQKLVLLLSLPGSPTGLVVGEYSPDDLPAARQQAQALAARFGVEVREYLTPQRTSRR